ncbi:MAG: adenylate/guanylate cyclase domain-containing protein [Parvularculaceae bacterium]
MKLRDAIFRPWRLAPFKLPQFLRAIVFAGVENYPRNDRRYLAVANVTGYLGMLSSLSFAISFSLFNFQALKAAVIGNLVSATLTALTPLTHRFGRSAAAIYLAIVFYSTLLFFVSQLGRDSGIQLNYIAAGAIVFTILGARRARLAFFLIAVALAFHLWTWFAFPEGEASAALTPELKSQLYIQSATTIMIILAVVAYYILRLTDAAQEQSQALLLNMMPRVIADRLIDDPETVVADHHEEATVMFADLREFTQLSSELGPGRTVELLDELFSTFDLLATRYGVEKIKTIGDAYMAVAGAPAARADHANAIMALALDMRQEVERLGAARKLSLKIRIGIESGPIVAGVIGRSKFAYDVWGRTVNVAARLQPIAGPGEILVGEGAKAALGDAYPFRYIGAPTLQGVGSHPAWLLARQEADPQARLSA